jgi:uncharacterized protein
LIYFDTSSLAKAYIDEARSDDVDEFLRKQTDRIAICQLSILEMRSTVARRAREGRFDALTAARVWSTFQIDISDELFEILSVVESDYSVATRMIDRVAPLPLKTLDAIHLAVAERATASSFATSDKHQLNAAEALGLKTISFLPH